MRRPNCLRYLAPASQVRVVGSIAISMGCWFLLSMVVSLVSYKSVALPAERIGWFRLLQITGIALYFICGVGLMRYRNWARYLFIALTLWSVPYTGKCYFIFAYRLRYGGVAFWWYEVLGFLVAIAQLFPFWALWILTRPQVKNLFTPSSVGKIGAGSAPSKS